MVGKILMDACLIMYQLFGAVLSWRRIELLFKCKIDILMYAQVLKHIALPAYTSL